MPLLFAISRQPLLYFNFCMLFLSLTSSERLMYDQPAPLCALLDHIDGLFAPLCVCGIRYRELCYKFYHTFYSQT